MSKIIDGVAVSGQGTIAQRFAKLLFTFKYAGSVNAGVVLAALAAIKLRVTKFHSSYGQQEVWKDGLLLNRIEANAHLQSAINVTNDGVDTTVKGSVLVVDENFGGSINPRENEKFVFDLTAIPANVTVTMHSIEFPGDAKVAYEFNYTFIGSGVPTPVNVAGAKLLLLTRSLLTSLELRYRNGRNIVLLPEEIGDLMDDHKQAAYVKNGLVTPGGELLFIVDVEDAVLALVTYSGNGAAETLVPVPVNGN